VTVIDWKGKRVLVTGATGFIGSHLTERLVSLGARVRAFAHYNSRNDRGLLEFVPADTRNEIEVVMGDLKDPESVRRAVHGQEVVFHLGALISIPYSYVNPYDVVQVNVLGTAHMLNAALEYGVELFVHTSTSETYGTAQYQPIDEKHPLVGQSPYAASKIGADKLAESYHRSFRLPVATVRPFNTYGPRQSARAVIPTIIKQALRGDEVRLGATSPARDFLFVADTVEGFMQIAESPGAVGHAMNIGSGSMFTVGEIVEHVGSLLGRLLRVTSDPARMRPETSEVTVLIADYAKAAAVVGWRPRIGLDEGLRRTIEWVKEHERVYTAGLYDI
jgi:dTDP-glucose 4,6-dehydratase